MIRIGEVQDLKIVKKTDFGVYLGNEEERVLLPRKQVPENVSIGDTVTVFIYRDSQDRLLATTNKPALVLGEVARLEVKDTGKIGAFLDWGLEKDLFLPFKEQTYRVHPGDNCLVALYVDKSSRLCATMNVYKYLGTTTQYKRGDMVSGTAYQYIEKFGMYVAVDDMYQGLIPKKECYGVLNVGEKLTRLRVTNVTADGRLELAVREVGYLQRDDDAAKILETIEEFDGVLPFSDKASPEVIKRELGMSKASFKRAVGKLLKEGRIELSETSIRLK